MNVADRGMQNNWIVLVFIFVAEYIYIIYIYMFTKTVDRVRRPNKVARGSKMQVQK